MAHIPGKFVWFELVTADSNKSKAFYGELLGWTTKALPMGEHSYEMIETGGTGIGGFTPQPKGGRAGWHSYVSVADVDAAAKRVSSAGGKVIDGPTDIPTVGRIAKVADPQGATFSLFKSEQDDPEDVQLAPLGAFCWNELWARDDASAVAFYEKAIGYTHDDMDMGPAGTYRTLKAGGSTRGGVMKSPDAKVDPMWLPYVHVKDCDGSTARAQKLGGKVVREPTDIPNMGRYSILLDPQGSAIALFTPAAR